MEIGDPARLPTACWAMGTKELKWYTVRKTIFCTGPTRAAKTKQKSLVPAQQAQRTNQGNDLVFLYSLSPHLPQPGPL
jgi:hypothetical protein